MERFSLRIEKKATPLFIRMVASMLISLRTSRLLLEAFGVDNFGVYNVVAGVVMLMGVVNGALLQATTRFVTFSIGTGNIERFRSVFSSALVVHGAAALLSLIVGETAGLWFVDNYLEIPEHVRGEVSFLYQYVLFTVVVTLLRSPYEALAIAEEKTTLYSRIALAEAGVRLIGAYFIGRMMAERMVAYSLIILCMAVVVGVIYYLSCRRSFPNLHTNLFVDISDLREMGEFAGMTLFRSGAWILRTQGLNVLLNLYCGPEANASFSLANQVGSSLGTLASGIAVFFQSPVVKAFSRGEKKLFIVVLARGTFYVSIVVLAVGIPLMLFPNHFLALWLESVPAGTPELMRLIVAASMLEGFGIMAERAQGATGRVALYNILIGSTVLLTLPVAWGMLAGGAAPPDVFRMTIALSGIMLIERAIILRRTIKKDAS